MAKNNNINNLENKGTAGKFSAEFAEDINARTAGAKGAANTVNEKANK